MTTATARESAPGARVPAEFLWGASTAAHQIEGNNVSSDNWRLEGPDSYMSEYSGDAIDSYHRYPEDMRLLAEAGLNSYRFSIEWARIEPERDRWSNAQLAHYRRMIETAWEFGLEPVVTLHHFTSPYWFSEAGGWTAPDAMDRWTQYIERVSTILDGVNWVCTINEPNILALMMLLRGMSPQGGEGGAAAAAAATTAAASELIVPEPGTSEALIEAHRIAVRILRERTNAKLGWTVAQQAFTPTPGNEEVFERVNWAWEDQFLVVSRDDDFVGVQTYTTQPVGPDGPIPHPSSPDNTLTGWAYRPDAMGIALRHTHEVTGVPLMVTENGIATGDDKRRIEYTTEALRHLLEVLEEGIEVLGYLHWTALDNYEWGKWAPTFGLIAVDRETFERKPKPSLAWLGGVARTGAAEIPTGSRSFAPDPEAAQATAAGFSKDSTVGAVLDDPRARAIVEEFAPGIGSHPMIGMARGFSVAMVAGMAKDVFPSDKLDELDRRLREIPA